LLKDGAVSAVDSKWRSADLSGNSVPARGRPPRGDSPGTTPDGDVIAIADDIPELVKRKPNCFTSLRAWP
jgi:hypothetical protein